MPEALRKVPYVNLPAQYAREKDEILACVDAVFSRGEFVGGGAVERFESEAAEFMGVKHAVGLNSGTDALIFALRLLDIGPGDEVITPPNSFVASTACIAATGATPVFADVQPDQNIDPTAVEAAITPRTKAIMPVHLTGRIADMNRIMAIAEKHRLFVIEDAAQAIGSTYDGKMSGTFGDIGCFSLHPLKNLNAAGDGGLLVTNDAQKARRAKLLRNHGLVDRNRVEEWGTVSRLDTLQAEIASLRLRRLPDVIARRRHNANLYRDLLAEAPVFMPPCRNIEFNTFHTFVVQVDRRDELQKYLTDRGIGTAIHYPIPIHLQDAARPLGHKPGDFPATETQADRILTLPVHDNLSDEDIAYVCEHVRAFYV